jgi:hypothetical protein
MLSTRAALLAHMVFAATACTGDIEALTPAQREAVAAYVTSEPPSPQNRIDAQLGRRVKLLGYDLDRVRWRPGETMRVTWYWEVMAPPGKGWSLFTHIENARSGHVLRQNGNGTLRWLYGPEHWLAGQYVRDVQDLHLPEDWRGDAAVLYVGLSREGERMPVSGSAEHADGRVRAAVVPTPTERLSDRSRRALPRVSVVRAPEPPRLDGSLLDPVWKAAQRTRPFVETKNGGPAAFEASAKLLWDVRYLYLGIEVQDALLIANETDHDGHLWEQDCVEVMIDPDGDGRGYFEIQVSPRGVVFDTRYDARRVPKPFGRVDWESKTRVGVSVRGELDDEIADAGYTVEIAIPWQAFSVDGGPSSAPAVGEQWRANLYVMDLGPEHQRAAAWSPLGISDFHVPHRFGILVFEGPSEEMKGSSEPLKIPAGRVPASFRRGSDTSPSVKDTTVEMRQKRRGLESSGGGH